jgi:MFS family permease
MNCAPKSLLQEGGMSSEVETDQRFPYFHFSILLSSGFASGIALTGLFPYVSFMVMDIYGNNDVFVRMFLLTLNTVISFIGGDINHAGYVSGFVASSFMIGRLFSSFFWGRVADKIGRKPVFYIASLAVASMSLLFGLSVNVYMAIGARFCLGLMNPITGLIKTVVSKLCIEKHQQRLQ